MSQWSGRSKGTPTGYKIFIFLIKYFGINAAYFLLKWVAFYFFIKPSPERKAIKEYFTKIQNFPTLKAEKAIYKNFILLGQSLIDKIVIMANLPNKFTFDFDGEEHLHNLAENGEGGFLIGAHTGNWEIAGYLLKRIKTPINIVMVEHEHENIKKLMDNVIRKRPVNIISIKNDMSHLFEISMALKRNEIIVIHGDRYIPGTKTITKKLLNHPAKFPTGVFYLAVKQQKPVVFVSALKESKKHYHFYATKPQKYTPKGHNRQQIINKIVDDYIKNLEQILTKYPEQWYNYYYFWDTKQ
jgi:predicted LPLAT superfamily acyltransferase